MPIQSVLIPQVLIERSLTLILFVHQWTFGLRGTERISAKINRAMTT